MTVPFEPEPAPAAPVAPTISLKPRLKFDVTEAPSPVEQSSAPSLAPTVFEPEAVTAIEPSKFKLKQKTAEPTEALPASELVAAVAPVEAARPPPAPKSGVTGVDPTTLPPPFPVVARSSVSKDAHSLPPPVPRLAFNRPAKIQASTGQSAGGGKSKKFLLLGVLGLAIVAAGSVGYLKFVGAASTPIPVPAAVAEPIAEKPAPRPSTPSATLNELSAQPARAIRKAEDVVASVRANEQNRVDELTGEESTTLPTTFSRKANPTPKPVAPTTATTQLAPGVTATSTASNVSGEATAAFRSWVAQARISGVFQGNPARALINGRTVSAGQVVDELLAITFEGVDHTAKTLVFIDGTGAKVIRKF